MNLIDGFDDLADDLKNEITTRDMKIVRKYYSQEKNNICLVPANITQASFEYIA